MIFLLLKARHVAFAAVTLLLVGLMLFGRSVSYEQSIKSFFADTDPVMAAYQQAAKSFGDDNFVFSGELSYLLGQAKLAAATTTPQLPAATN